MMDKRRQSLRAVVAAGLVMLGGCASNAIQPDVSLLEQSAPYLYSDADWSEVLHQFVRQGLVNYAELSAHPESLKRYYALLSRVGPTMTPDQFASRPQVVAYWVNAYNAMVLLVVLQNYPISTVYDLSLPPLDHGYTFVVDGRPYTLASIESKVLEESANDVRVLFAMSRASMGTPRLLDQPLRASLLERQLNDAAAMSLDNPDILRIDHTTQSIQVWQVILGRQDAFLEYWRSRRRVATAFLFNVLLELTSPPQRRALQSAVGYVFRQIPFDRSLNEWKPPSTSTAE